MAVQVGSAVATLTLDIAQYQRSIAAASEQFRALVAESEQAFGFSNTAADLQALTRMINTLAQLENWTTAERIAGFERVQGLYINNVRERMDISARLHQLKRQQIEEEYNMELQRIRRLNTGDMMRTDFAGIIAEYERLREVFADDAERAQYLTDRITEAAENRKNKLLQIKRDEVDGLQRESRRQYDINRPFSENESADLVAFYARQIALGRQVIDMLTAQEAALTQQQRTELGRREAAEADFQARMMRLVNEAVVARRDAEETVTEALALAQLAREDAEETHLRRKAEVQDSARTQRLRLEEDFARQMEVLQTRLIENEERLTEAYERALAGRKAALLNFAGLFDQVNVRDVTGEMLTGNLQSQVDAMESYAQSLEALAARGINETLFNQLQAMGPGRHAELAAIAAMDDEALARYEALYLQRLQMAEQQAEAQMAAERQRLTEDILAVRNEMAAQMAAVTDAHRERVRELYDQTREMLAELTQAWQEADAEIVATLEASLATQEEAISRSVAVKAAAYQSGGEAQRRVEIEKTAQVRAENARQEHEVETSQNRNVETLWGFVPAWRSVGEAYGDALLQGIQGTRWQIEAYLQEVSMAVRTAQAGFAVNISAFDAGITGFGGDLHNAAFIDYEQLGQAVAKAMPNQGSIHYSPTYNSPKEASIGELMQQDRINMRRLGMRL